MKKNITYLTIVVFIIFIFLLFYKGLYKTNVYIPNELNNKNLIAFSGKDLFSEAEINITDLIIDNKFTIINIWASWCVPCRAEHHFLMDLSKNSKVNLIGINYRDNPKKTIKWLKDLGNPYKYILIDKNGKIAIDWGVYGIPETFIVNSDGIIKYRHVGPITNKIYKKIILIIKQNE